MFWHGLSKFGVGGKKGEKREKRNGLGERWWGVESMVGLFEGKGCWLLPLGIK